MDVSLNNIKNKINDKPSFMGVKGEYSSANVPVFKFTPPPYDKNNEKVELELAFLGDKEVKNSLVSSQTKIITREFNENETFDLPQDAAIGYSAGIGYRYKITKKDGSIRYVTDNYATIGVENCKDAMNIIKLWGGCMIDSKPGTMTHRFLDSDSIALTKGDLDDRIQNPRNHFNVYGGSMKGLIKLITSGEFDPYRYVITNPDLGNDRMSSHRYWPCNLYQCSNIKDFKDVNWELFTRGKGYVADGAFTSQGIESPMFQHVLKWGEESPFFNMFKFDDPQGVIKLGILPDHDIESDVDEFSHLGIRIVNNPYDKENYDFEKPIYIQFYDDRMASQKAIEDTTKLIDKYDQQPEDIFEISSYDDSMYPYYFELNPEAITYKYVDKIGAFKDKDFMSLNELDELVGLDSFLNFGKFTITSRNRAGGATFWDGNRDIVKLNLTNAHNNTSVEYAKQNRDGMKKARNYVFGAAEYWSEAIQGDLILRLAKIIQSKNTVEDILSKNDIEKTDELFNTEGKVYPTIKEDKKLDEYILHFPLQSMETSPEMSAIFSQSDFNELLLQYDDFAENYEIGDDNYIYKNGNKVDFSELNPPDFNMFVSVYIMANEIIDNIVNSLPEKTTDDKGEYRAYLLKTYANDIIKCIYAQALNKDAVEGGKVNNVELGCVGLRAIMKEQTQPLPTDASSPKHEKEAVIRKIQKGLKNVDYNAIEDRIKKEVQYISLKDFKNAETIVLQAKAGLNWRFDAAKDIGDMDAIKSDAKRFRDVWDERDGVVDFWNKFIDKARKYNPSAYVIAEITDLWSLYNIAPENFDINGIDPNIKEKDFLHKINASTSSDYSNFFNKLSCFVGTNPEKLNDDSNHPLTRSGNLEELRGNYLGFLRGNQEHNALLTHLFFENHDKPRALHSMPLDMEMFLCDDGNIHGINAMSLDEYLDLHTSKKEEYTEDIIRLTGSSDFKNLAPKAVAVGLMFQKYIDSLSAKQGYTKEQKEAMLKALRELVLGKKKVNSEPNFKRANAFATQAYEVTIKEILKRARITDRLDDRVRDFRYNMLKKYIDYEERMWQMINALVGVPTMYNGMEFAQTGYETPSKNQYVNNRNQIMHSDVRDKRFRDVFNKIYATSNLYRYPGLNAIREGSPIVCNINKNNASKEYNFPEGVDVGNFKYCHKKIEQNFTIDEFKEFMDAEPPVSEICKRCSIDPDNAENIAWYYFGFEDENGNPRNLIEEYWQNKIANARNIDILPVVKYDNKGSTVLTVITNNGVPRYEYSYQSDEKLDKNFSVSSINLQNGEKGVFALPEGLELKKMIYDKETGTYRRAYYTDDKGNHDEVYIVENGVLRNKRKGEPVKLEDTVVNFYVPTSEEKESKLYAKYMPCAYFAK